MFVICPIDHRGHFRHGLNSDDALDRKVRLVIDGQVICRRPVSSIVVSNV